MDFLVGIIVGAILCYIFVDRKTASGSFVIDLTDDAKEPFVLNVYQSLDEIYTKKQIVFDVKVREDNSPN